MSPQHNDVPPVHQYIIPKNVLWVLPCHFVMSDQICRGCATSRFFQGSTSQSKWTKSREQFESSGMGCLTDILETGNVIVVFKISVSKELGLSSRSLFWSCFRKDNFGFFSVILFKALWLAGINAWRHILNVIFTLFADVLPRKTLPNKMIRFLIGLLRQPALFPLMCLGQDKLYFLPNFFRIHLQWFHRISS